MPAFPPLLPHRDHTTAEHAAAQHGVRALARDRPRQPRGSEEASLPQGNGEVPPRCALPRVCTALSSSSSSGGSTSPALADCWVPDYCDPEKFQYKLCKLRLRGRAKPGTNYSCAEDEYCEEVRRSAKQRSASATSAPLPPQRSLTSSKLHPQPAVWRPHSLLPTLARSIARTSAGCQPTAIATQRGLISAGWCATRRRARSATSTRARSGECARRRLRRSGSAVWPRSSVAALLGAACACRLRLPSALVVLALALPYSSPAPDQPDWDVDHEDDEPLPVDFHFYTPDPLLYNSKLHINEDSPMAAPRIPPEPKDEL